MKKLFIILVIISLIVIGYTHDQFLWCKKLLLGNPTTHTIQKGEYLSEIAKKYYGKADYWRELALINRAPYSDLVFPGEEIVIPSTDVIKKIRRTRWLSKVNGYVKEQEEVLAHSGGKSEHSLATIEPETTAEPITTTSKSEQLPIETESVNEINEPVKSFSIYLVLAVISIIFIGALITFILYRRKKQEQEISIVDDIDFDLTDEKEETEPDYKEYLRNKDKTEKEALVT